ncbi:hypothetical protein [Formosa algae]|jgi:hypothetical protein|uniref:Uncharacterized protein n=1 Tax=Formosa algae TaxID=225843 RepID=A0A9X0YNM4_9FLAO|nr:hypothetical protein [Formosa algae]MBP1840537.1 hypothetical protein [Formosa algae]MDQ0336050.1 hypothetical protein [Formosa algae]OEI81065.1 hypothetical protein AST99_05225 [Formosa algae]
MDFKTMLQLPVLDTTEVLNILQEIADLERHKERPQMPQVTISTTNDSATGFFVNYDSDKRTILLCDMYDRKAQFQYIASHSVSSVSIRNIEAYGYLLSDGTILFTPSDDEIPTVLQLKKDIKALEDDAQSLLGKPLAISYNYEGTPEDLDKFYASKVLTVLQNTLSKIGADHLAKTAFTDAIASLNFTLGKDNTSVLNQDVLTLTIDTTKGLKSFPKAAQLQEQIETFL